MRKALVIVAVGLVLLAAWLIYPLFTGFPGRPVPSSLIAPPVIVTLTRSNAPLRFFPGVGGVLLVLPDNSLWQWGQIGPGNWARSKLPSQVGTNCDWQQAFVGNNHCLALGTNGTLWEWGWRGGNRFTSAPEQIDPGHDWVGIAAGDVHSVALKCDGTIWSWGANPDGQLGNGIGPDRTNLAQVGTNHDWAAIERAQNSGTLAIRSNGTLWAWGEIYAFGNTNYTKASYPYPVQVCRETNWAGFAQGINPGVQTREGQLWLPFYSLPNADAATAASCRLGSSNWVTGRFAQATTDEIKQYEVRSDGTLWETPCGFSRKTRQLSALNQWRKVGKRSDWVFLGSSGGTALGLTADGTVWMWGYDLGLDPIPDLRTRFTELRVRIRGWFGMRPKNWSGQSYFQYQREPRPLMRLIPPSNREAAHGPKE